MVYLVEGHILQEYLARGAKEHTIHEYAHQLTVKALYYHPYRRPTPPWLSSSTPAVRPMASHLAHLLIALIAQQLTRYTTRHMATYSYSK